MYIFHRKNVHLRHTYWFALPPAARRRYGDREETQYRSHRCTFSLRNTYIFATRHLDRRPRISLSVSSARFVFVKVLISPEKCTSTTWILIFLPARVTTTAEICRKKKTGKIAIRGVEKGHAATGRAKQARLVEKGRESTGSWKLEN